MKTIFVGQLRCLGKGEGQPLLLSFQSQTGQQAWARQAPGLGRQVSLGLRTAWAFPLEYLWKCFLASLCLGPGSLGNFSPLLGEVGLDDLRGPFQPEPFRGSMSWVTLCCRSSTEGRSSLSLAPGSAQIPPGPRSRVPNDPLGSWSQLEQLVCKTLWGWACGLIRDDNSPLEWLLNQCQGARQQTHCYSSQYIPALWPK